MLNCVIIMGRLCADPELKQTSSGLSYCKIRVAVNRPYSKDAEEQKADFINVTCWRQTAEFVCRYFNKGKMIVVEGSLQNNDYTDSNGVKHYSMDVVARNVSFGESKNGGESAQNAPQTAPAAVPRFDTLDSPPMTRPAQAAVQDPRNAVRPQQQFTQKQLDTYSEEIISDGEIPF